MGCGGEPSRREVDNARAFEALLTAVSLRNEKELAHDAKLINERHEAGEPLLFERVGEHDPATVALHVQERVSDRDGHLVPERRAALGVAVDQDVHARVQLRTRILSSQ